MEPTNFSAHSELKQHFSKTSKSLSMKKKNIPLISAELRNFIKELMGGRKGDEIYNVLHYDFSICNLQRILQPTDKGQRKQARSF
jgi:hypothetical protein